MAQRRVINGAETDSHFQKQLINHKDAISNMLEVLNKRDIEFIHEVDNVDQFSEESKQRDAPLY